MNGENKSVDLLPDSFETEDEAGEFWDTHSTMDYQEHLEATDDTIEVTERTFECRLLKMDSHQPKPKFLEILRKELK